MDTTIDYWFTIEPYVYVNIVNNCAFIYNTLDGMTIESDKKEVISLLQELLREENCGVVLLNNERYRQKNIHAFIDELRKKYMGDVIASNLSEGKPVQILPYINFPQKQSKKYNFSLLENRLDTLSEITIYIDNTIESTKTVSFLQTIPGNVTLNIKGDIGSIANNLEILSFLNCYPAPKNIFCSYLDIADVDCDFGRDFSYKISVCFPIDKQKWENSIKRLQNKSLEFECVFEVSSDEDYQQAEQIVEQYPIEQHQLKPVYTGENIAFFEENIFLVKEDILSTSMSIKDFFFKQNMNTNDFGKINIFPNGDVYANLNHPVLGNIATHSIDRIVSRELEEGKSWLRVRYQAPCNNCIYQWLCPSPSDYEIAIDRSNLCHVK